MAPPLGWRGFCAFYPPWPRLTISWDRRKRLGSYLPEAGDWI